MSIVRRGLGKKEGLVYQFCPQNPAVQGEEVFDLVLSFADEEQDAYRAVHDFESSDGSFRINDFWEADLTEYTYHYVWCCYAISWGIMKYDKFDIVKAAA